MSRINYARMQEDNTRHFLFWLFCYRRLFERYCIIHLNMLLLIFLLIISLSCPKYCFGILAFTFRFTEFHVYKVKEEAALDG